MDPLKQPNTLRPLPRAVWEGEIKIGSLSLQCAVLDNGQRVVTQDSMVAFLEWLDSGPPLSAEDAAEFAYWLRGEVK
jgi:hypothetical protein